MSKASADLKAFQFEYLSAADDRRRRQVVAQYQWLLDLIQAKLPNFRLADDIISAVVDVMSRLGAIRTIRFDSDEALCEDVITLAADRLSNDSLIRFLSLQGGDLVKFTDMMVSCNVVVCSDMLADTENDDVMFCQYYDRWVIDDDGRDVRISRREKQYWCSDARDECAFYCDVSNQWYSCDSYSAADTVGGLTICTEIAADYDYYRCSNGDYSDDADDYEDYDDEDNTGIPDYHGADRDWNYYVADCATRGFFGFEIELDFPTWDHRKSCWEEVFSKDNRFFCAERDGSLDNDTGMEIITRPFSLHDLRMSDAPMRQMLQKITEGFGAKEGHHDQYGVHVTTNFGRLTHDHRERFARFICVNRSLSEYVARREGNEYCNYEWNWHEKHAAVALRPNHGAVEVRIFKSSVEYDVLLSYAEYLEAVIEWTRDPDHLVAGPLATSLFRHWVCLSGQYPCLTARFPRQTAKEIHPCVLPSPSRPVECSRKKSSPVASSTILTDADSHTAIPTAIWSWFDVASSISTTSTRRTSQLQWT